jgi:methylenetetrahydrofolate reductase (NADPH)
MKVTEHLANADGPLVSFEIIPPKRGGDLKSLLALIGCVGAGSAVMLNASRRSTTAEHSPPDAGH